jgi:hypothetical protein
MVNEIDKACNEYMEKYYKDINIYSIEYEELEDTFKEAYEMGYKMGYEACIKDKKNG